MYEVSGITIFFSEVVKKPRIEHTENLPPPVVKGNLDAAESPKCRKIRVTSWPRFLKEIRGLPQVPVWMFVKMNTSVQRRIVNSKT